MLLTMTQSGKSNHSKNSNRRISQCAGCGSEILDQYILKVAPDLEWHASCLKCAECQQVLNENSTCFVRQDKTYCKRDYNRLFGARCRLCRVEFKENDLVMRAKNSIYHTECFRCIVCDRVLSSGDEFCIREKGIYCKVDIDTADKQDSEFNNNNNNDSQKTETASDETKDSCEDVCMVPASNRTSNGKSQSRSESRSRSHKSDHKATRVRTVLNERQLHMLRTCYGANPRPDALMKEQLVEMTGLSPRVIRVWFQNKRCKDKKRTQLLKQIQQQQQQDKLPDFQGDPCELDDSMWLKGKNNAVVNFSPEQQQAWMTSLDAHMFHPWKSLEHDEHSNPHHHHHLPHQQHQQQLAFQQLMRNNFAISGDALCDDDDDAIVCLKESSHHNLMTSLDYSDDIYPGRDNSN